MMRRAPHVQIDPSFHSNKENDEHILTTFVTINGIRIKSGSFTTTEEVAESVELVRGEEELEAAMVAAVVETVQTLKHHRG